SIKGKIGDNLRAALDRLPLNRELVTIRTDVALAQGPEALVLRQPDVDTLRALYARYGFNQALRELEGGAATGNVAEKEPGRARGTGFATAAAAAPEGLDPALAAPGQYETITTVEQLQAWIAALRAAGSFALDTETDSLDPMRARLVGLSFAAEPGRAAYLPLGHDYPGAPAQLERGQALDLLRPLLADPAVRKLGQHGKYDLHVLRRHGVPVAGYADDTLLESFVLDSGNARHDMDSLALRHLGYTTVKYEDVCGKGAKQIPFSQCALDDATRYAAEDADITLRLHRVLSARLQAEPQLQAVYRDIEMPLVQVLERIEANGVLVDMEELRRQSARLFDELNLPVLVRTPKGQPSTNEEAPEAIADLHELPRIILEYRGLAKLRSPYADKLPAMVNPETGRVHTSYRQAGAATGRLSSSDPNLQNIPIRTDDGRRIRRAFVAPPGRKLIACDYSQIELRIMAHLSQDAGLLRAFASGADIHRATAAEVFGRPLEEVT